MPGFQFRYRRSAHGLHLDGDIVIVEQVRPDIGRGHARVATFLAEIARVVVREAHHIEARIAQVRGIPGGRAKEEAARRALALLDRLPAVHQHALEIAEGDIGGGVPAQAASARARHRLGRDTIRPAARTHPVARPRRARGASLRDRRAARFLDRAQQRSAKQRVIVRDQDCPPGSLTDDLSPPGHDSFTVGASTRHASSLNFMGSK